MGNREWVVVEGRVGYRQPKKMSLIAHKPGLGTVPNVSIYWQFRNAIYIRINTYFHIQIYIHVRMSFVFHVELEN